jgi:hypothetical protein
MAKRAISVCITIISVIILTAAVYAETGAVISEVMANPENGISGADDEYIEIVNTGTEPIDLAACWLATANGRKQKLIPYTGMYGHGAGTLLAPSGVALITSPRYSGAYAGFIQKNALSGLIHITIDGTRFLSYGLGNNAGVVFLLDDAGRTLDAFSWTSDAGKNVSWEKENPHIQSGVLVKRVGGTPGLVPQYLAASDSWSTRARLVKRIVRRGEQGRVILMLKAGEYARIVLKHRDGREIAVIQNRVEGAGRHEVPVALVRPTGEALISGSYILDLRVTSAQGRSAHETLLIQIAPGMR